MAASALQSSPPYGSKLFHVSQEIKNKKGKLIKINSKLRMHRKIPSRHKYEQKKGLLINHAV